MPCNAFDPERSLRYRQFKSIDACQFLPLIRLQGQLLLSTIDEDRCRICHFPSATTLFGQFDDLCLT